MTDRMTFRDDIVLESGQRLGDVMDAWQREDFLALDDPEHRHAYLERPRGHSKTGDAGSEAMVELFTGAPGRQLYAVAGDEDQATILFDDVAGKIRRNPALLKKVKIGTSRITVKATGSRLDVLSSDAPTAYGVRPDWLCLDELAEWRKRDLWDSLWSATGKRPDCRVIVISTAGWDRTSIAWEVRQIASTEADWLLSSRGQCATWIKASWLDQQQRTLPAHVFARLHLNQWVEGVGAFLTMAEVDAIFGPMPPATGLRALGLDLGLTKDRSVLAEVVGGPDGMLGVEKFTTWIPPSGGKVDLQDVEAVVKAEARGRLPVILDPFQAALLAQRLRSQGLAVQEFTFTSASRSALFGKLLDLIRRGKLRSVPNEEFRRELLGLEVTQTAAGWRADHRPGRHDDHVVAVALAVQRIAGSLVRGFNDLSAEEQEARRPEGFMEKYARRENDGLTEKILARYGAEKGQAIIDSLTVQHGDDPEVLQEYLLECADANWARLRRAGLR